jgi:hypothetical protein
MFYEQQRYAPGAAGVLVFVHVSQVERVQAILDVMNANSPVSREVLFLFMAKPTREAMIKLSNELQADSRLQGLERLERLRPNNALRDLTAPWRLAPAFCDEYYLLVSYEGVEEEYRKKYPDPNLTLQAGKIEPGETPVQCARRELFEEARIQVTDLNPWPIKLMSKGMYMYPTFVLPGTELHFDKNNCVFHIGPTRAHAPIS